jgi:HEAT repeat protein
MSATARTLSNRARARALLEIQEVDDIVRVEAAKVLASDSAAFVPLRELLRTATRPEVRLAIVFALTWQWDMRSWAIFIKLLGDRNDSPAVRAQAAEGLAYKFHRKRRGTLGFQAAIEVLVAALTDGSPDVRYYAAFALGVSGERKVVAALRKATKDQATSKNFVGTVGDEAMRAVEKINANN